MGGIHPLTGWCTVKTLTDMLREVQYCVKQMTLVVMSLSHCHRGTKALQFETIRAKCFVLVSVFGELFPCIIHDCK